MTAGTTSRMPTARIPRLYPILDAGMLQQAGVVFEIFARELQAAGVSFLQYRDKKGSDREVLERAILLRRIFPPSSCRLVLNDRVALVAASGFDGVHLGQDDVSPSEARAALGPSSLIGLSTHNGDQLQGGAASEADYLAIGPVFVTAAKKNPDPVVGLDGIRAARSITQKPLVAIGGITRANCSAVFDAGADSVAVISDLLPGSGEPARKRAREFLLLVQTRSADSQNAAP